MEENLFAGLFDAVPDALVVVDGQGRIVMANRQAEELFNYSHGGLAGVEIEALVPEEARKRHRAHRNGYMSRARIRPMGAAGMALVGLRRDGTEFPAEIALSPLQSSEGARFLASIRDISETQRARQELTRAGYDALVARIGQLALETEDEAAILDLVPPLLVEALNVDAVAIVFLNPDVESVDVRAAVGLDPDEAARRIDGRALARTLASASAHQIEELAHASSEECAFPLTADMENGSGVLLPLLDRSRPLGALIAQSRQRSHFDHDAMHLLQSVANLIAALVQRRRTEEQLAHAHRLDALGQLTGGIAHDFNNLLTVMSGSLQLLEEESQDKPEAQELIATALRSVSRGAELTGKLLAFARRQRLMPQAVDPAALLRDLESMLKRTLGDALRLRVRCKDAPAAYVDPTQLDTALVNLALNARDATPRGGEIAIEANEVLIGEDRATRELPVGYYVRFSVADNGRGMAPGVLARAMEPFFTTKEASRGSGLGLSMVYGFAKQSGGHLHIDSAPGRGTRVELYLPAARTPAPQPVAALSREPMGKGESVLVVEDDKAVRDIAIAFLRASGYRVQAVDNAAEALERLREDAGIAALFSDVMLGSGMDGRELARTARRMRPDLAVLLTSGYEERGGGGDATFPLLRKPYRREQLAQALRQALDASAEAPPPAQ